MYHMWILYRLGCVLFLRFYEFVKEPINSINIVICVDYMCRVIKTYMVVVKCDAVNPVSV